MANASENSTLAMGLWPTLMKGQMSKIHFWKQILECNKFSNLPQSNHHMQITTAISTIKIPVTTAGPPLRMLSFLYTGFIIVGGSQHYTFNFPLNVFLTQLNLLVQG
jgi:hypothetical protein